MALCGAKLFFTTNNVLPLVIHLIQDGKPSEALAALESGEAIRYQPHKKIYWHPCKWVDALAQTGWRHLHTLGGAGEAMEGLVRAIPDADPVEIAASMGKEQLVPFQRALMAEPSLLGLSEALFFVAENHQ